MIIPPKKNVILRPNGPKDLRFFGLRPQNDVVLFTLSFLLLFFQSSLYAKVSIAPDFQGTVVITYPSGEIALVEPGDPMPDIPAQASLEVFDGSFTVQTEEGDQVQVSCLGHSASVGGGASANLSCGEESGILKVLSGTAHLVDDDGEESDLPEGTELKLEVGEAPTAPATAAAELLGTPLGDNPPPPDSRSIESSPST